LQLTRQIRNLRRAEQLLLAYFGWMTVVGVTLGVRGVTRSQPLAINVSIAIGFVFLLSRIARDYEWRDVLPYPFALLCYREAGWITPAIQPHDLEHRWIQWDRLVLDVWHGRALIESLGDFLPSVLEAAYLSVYVIALLAVGALYLFRCREQVDRFWFAFLLGLMLSYIQFPFWPSEPPRTVFAGQDLPTFAGPLRQLNLFLVGNYGIHSSVFPSAHVSGAMAGALMLRWLIPGRRWPGNVMLAVAILIAVATIYGRYHYAVDAAAGAVVGVIAYRCARFVFASKSA
jgi:membrane-associated phospholipid phosphatase